MWYYIVGLTLGGLEGDWLNPLKLQKETSQHANLALKCWKFLFPYVESQF